MPVLIIELRLPVPGLFIENEQGVRRFARSKFRKEAAFKRDTQFDSNNFNTKDYLEHLENENVTVNLK